jgi:hypothetical protein
MAPPFMNSTGLVTKILDKIIEAQQPERFTQDYLATKLGFGSGSARPFIPMLKRLGFLGSDGTPTRLYAQFRNPDTRGAAMAEAIRLGYKDVYERNEYAHDLSKEKFKNLIVEMTGLKPNDATASAIVGTFNNLKTYAKFGEKLQDGKAVISTVEPMREDAAGSSETRAEHASGLSLSYTINLNLPETSDVEVFNAIFRSLKEHLLKR